MSNNMQDDIKTQGIVLRRTNFGEADRILNLITPVGKLSVIAKGVRKARSKLAGGVEMFMLADFSIHRGKSEMGTLTGARMVQYYGNIVKDLKRMEMAAMILKKISMAAEASEAPGFFEITKECLEGLNAGLDEEVVEMWFWLNLCKIMGEEVNLYRDVSGEKLVASQKYNWDAMEKGFVMNEQGEFGANEIKTMRLMVTAKLVIAARIKDLDVMTPKITGLLRTVVK